MTTGQTFPVTGSLHRTVFRNYCLSIDSNPKGNDSVKIRLKLLLATLTVTIATLTINAQERPYPQNFKYPYGYIPQTFKLTTFDRWYARYKAQSSLLQSCNGGIRTSSGSADTTKVESMGWAMIIAAYMGDKETFDGLLTYYKSKRQGHGMMAWLTSCNGIYNAGSASDGDLDAAFALVVATWQWGGSYKTEANNVISACKKLITNCNGTSTLYGGISGNNGYGGCQQTDLSYYTPAFFREFAEFSGDNAWTKLADDTYTLLNAGANGSTGLVPDWQQSNGSAANGYEHNYKFDACRVPWRIALDYLWNGNEKAHTWCKKISDWAYKTGPRNIKDGYNLDGTVTGSNHSMSFLGGFAVAAMCNTQQIADDFADEVGRMQWDSYWYHAYLGTCYMLAMSGNMWNMKLKDKQDTTVSVGGRRNGMTSTGVVSIGHSADRVLTVSGVTSGSSVSLATLDGKNIVRNRTVSGTCVSLDVSSVGKGCYVLTVRKADAGSVSRMVSVY